MKNQEDEKELLKAIVKMSGYTIYVALIILACIVILIVSLSNLGQSTAGIPPIAAASQAPASAAGASEGSTPRPIPAHAWKAPDDNTIPTGKAGELIRYGRELIAHTARYFGPKGSIAMITNGMNCQNCHLAGGTKLFGNDYACFIASYPKMSGRSGKIQSASERVAECFERSLAGKVPDTAGREIQSILAYLKWVGKDVKKGQNLFGNATEKLAFMNRAANPVKGQQVFAMKCQSCHGANGEGLLAADKKDYTNPPLWGKHSYNDGAGLYRISNLAGFVKNNMPFGATYENPQLTDEEAWDIAAFINTQPRPHKNQHNDWIDLKNKPMDFPFGPYADTFSEKQHKLGPFKPIEDAQTALNTKKI
ncbi:c-type cytochrome [Mucilaginibacter sp. FT3.2]|uniref:c-type cytochrome n=1 Tax=Mucilaginibacter sp. FT3.2 TaxID=2723090 RepID=UPI00160A41BB|nr:c-type cytochrome [Mucilaginibacter sp. FT3.2]MBB6234537.1 thiosulfate dehydrogenase [Mucilaginibacter sp. FT3.2]